MADVTKAPVLDTLTRNPDGSLRFTWTNHATTSGYYTSIQVLARVAGGGVFTGVNTLGYPAISNRVYNQYTKPGGGVFLPNVGYELQLRAYGPLGWSAYSNIRSVPAMKTPTPAFDSITRTGAATARIVLAGVHNLPAKTDTIHAYRRVVGTGSYVSAGSVAGTATTMDITGLASGSGYEVYLRAQGPAGWSDNTTVRSVGAWAQTPVAPSILGAQRDTTTGAVTITWEGSPTAQAPWRSIEIWLAYGETEPFTRVATLAGSARTWTGAATATRPVRVRIIAKSDAGDAQATSSSMSATVLVPNAPTGLSASYVATNKAALSWSRSASAERPYTSQRVGYRSEGGGAWTWSSVPVDATSATVSLPPNGRYQLTVDAGNTAGRSEIANPVGPIITTPAGPYSLSAQWEGSNIRVMVPPFSTVGDLLVIETSTDNTTWFPAAELPVSATSWLHPTPSPGLPHWYRARVTSGGLSSGTVTSAVVLALTKPAAPTILPPVSLDATAPIPVSIVHNPLDGTGQTAGEVRHRVGTGAYSTITLGTSPTGTIPAGARANGQVLLISARTQGAAGEWSDWSPESSWTLRPRPTGTLTAPAATVTGQAITATWTAAAQTSALVELLDANGLVVEAREVAAATRSVTFTHPAIDYATYTVRLTVRDDYQASLPILRGFTVALDRPDAPTASASFDPGLALVSAAVTAASGTVRVELWRDGQMVGTAVPVDGHATLVDLLPRLTVLTYTVRAYSATGGWSESAPASVDATSRDCRLNFGAHGELQVRGGHLERTGSGGGREVVMVREVAGGVTAYRSEDVLPLSLSVTVYLHSAANVSTVAEWMDALAYDGPVTYREPLGRTITGAATLDSWVDADRFQGAVSFTITEEAL